MFELEQADACSRIEQMYFTIVLSREIHLTNYFILSTYRNPPSTCC